MSIATDTPTSTSTSTRTRTDPLVLAVAALIVSDLGNDELTTGLAAYQTFLLIVTGAVGTLAAWKATKRSRTQ